MSVAIFATFLVAAALSVVCWRKSVRHSHLSRLMRTMVPLLLWTVCGGLAYRILETPKWTFNGTRLGPVFALTRGYSLYYPRESGPILETTYAPIAALFYLPTTALRTPNSAVIAGSTLTVICCLVPLVFLTFLNPSTKLDFSRRLFGFLVSGLMVLYCEPLRYSCINVHADGPALAFGGMACVCLLRWRYSRLGLTCGAIFAALSPFAKQTAIGLIGGLALYLVLADGWKMLGRFLLLYAVASLVILSGFMLAFDPRRLWFNLVTVQAKMIASTDGLAIRLVQGTRSLIHSGDLVCLAVAVAVVSAFVSHNREPSRIRLFVRRNDWSLLFCVGLFGIPVSILARVKPAGDINSYSFVLYYFNAAVGMFAAELIRFQPQSAKRSILSAYQITALGLLIILFLIEAPTPFGIPRTIQELADTDLQVAYQYLVKHPGSAYFPWFPLSHIIAEGRAYHSAFGVADRELSGNRLSPQHFHSGIPAGTRFVAYRSEGIDNIHGCDLRSYLPEFPTVSTTVDLPGWTILTRGSALR